MIVKVRKTEVYPVYEESNRDDKDFESGWNVSGLYEKIDVDPRIWEDYKMAKRKFLRMKKKVEEKGEFK